MRTVDLNADLGESFGSWTMGDDEALLGVVTSANVACGFHAGDPTVMLRTLRAAADRGVVVGAHVSYRDLAGFGRRFVDVDPAELRADVLYQLAALAGLAAVVGARVGYVKPHGALYNAIVTHPEQAGAVVGAIGDFDESLALLGLPGIAHELARGRGIRTVVEAFADRGYRPDGTLVPRREPGALLHDPRVVAERMVGLVRTGVVEAVDGTEVAVEAESICVHGDSPGAVALACSVREAMAAADIGLAPFVS
ncbi:LamB/YcsF family protein [Aestuariimicrobium kwangyangense]|uniref:LamB/YcsF family protein n=1 Tax=Aestuariimicrobium kwangyangense TaxID=396389 RepID=UPI0003B4C814|nr:5-oxoprolinase subunit PxpA [Aestuariimicrobium kwangyangense]